MLGGEDPIDHVQRETLRSGRDLHPLFEMIMRHHVTEEARHLSFARHYLKAQTPQLSRGRKAVMAVATPLILGTMAQLMMQAPREPHRHASMFPPRSCGRPTATTRPTASRPRSPFARSAGSPREIGIVRPALEAVVEGVRIWADD